MKQILKAFTTKRAERHTHVLMRMSEASVGSKPVRGFTLVETLTVLAIVVTVGVALTSAIQFFYRSNAYLLESTSALDNARRGIGDTVLSLREASFGDDGSYPVAAAATSTVQFYADIDNDGTVEKIRYYLLNGTLFRGVTDAAGYPPSYTGQPEVVTTIATFVRNTAAAPLFTYYDSTGTALTSPVNVSSITAIMITAQIDLNPARAPNIFTLTQTATLRNVRAQ